MKITDQAKEQLKTLIANNNVSGLRIFIEGMGWGGPQIGMALDEPQEDDTVKEINEIQVSFAKMADTFAQNITLDNQNGRFMLLNNPSNC